MEFSKHIFTITKITDFTKVNFMPKVSAWANYSTTRPTSTTRDESHNILDCNIISRSKVEKSLLFVHVGLGPRIRKESSGLLSIGPRMGLVVVGPSTLVV